MRVVRWASILVVVLLGAWAFRVLLEEPAIEVQREVEEVVVEPERVDVPTPDLAPVELARDGMVRYVGRVVDEAGTPVAGVSVAHVPNAHTLGDAIVPLEGGKVERRLPRNAMATVLTAVDGTFTHVVAEPKAISGRRWPHAPMLVVEASGFATRPVPCHMTLGDAEVDVGVITLEPDIVVRGRAVAEETGHVQRGYTVRAWSATTSERWSRAVDTSYWGALDYRRDAFGVSEAVALADGTFEVRGLSGGLFAVEIAAEGFATWRSEGLSADAGSTIDLGNVELAPAHTLEFEVLDGTHGAALSGATVAAIHPECMTNAIRGELAYGGGADDTAIVGVGLSTKKGYAIIDGLDDAVYTVVISAPGYASLALDSIKTEGKFAPYRVTLVPLNAIKLPSIGSAQDVRFEAWAENDDDTWHPLEIHQERWTSFVFAPRELDVYVRVDDPYEYVRVMKADAGSLEFRDIPGAVTGPSPAVEGVVVNEDNAPVAGATVVIRRAARAVHERRVVADARGRFKIHHAYDGQQELIAEAPGYHTRLRGVPVDERPGDYKVPIEKLGALRGVCVDEEGVPAVGVDVTLARPLDEVSTRTNADGIFGFHSVPHGSWMLMVPGVVTEEVFVTSKASAPVTLTLRPGLSANVPPGVDLPPFLPHLTRLRGHVRRELSPIAFAVVSWRGVDEPFAVARHVIADAAGFFEIDVGEEGEYILTARAADGSLAAPVRALALAESDVDVELNCGAWSIAGKVEIGERMFGREYAVALRHLDSGMMVQKSLGPDGKFKFRRIARTPTAIDIIALNEVVDSFPIDDLVPDIGTLHVDGRGTLRVTLGSYFPGDEVIVSSGVDDRDEVATLKFSETVTSAVQELQAGTYRVTYNSRKLPKPRRRGITGRTRSITIAPRVERTVAFK